MKNNKTLQLLRLNNEKGDIIILQRYIHSLFVILISCQHHNFISFKKYKKASTKNLTKFTNYLLLFTTRFMFVI